MCLKSKFGSITRAWRVGLDRDERGLLTFGEFCRAAKEIGFEGELRTLWFNLDDDNSGYVSLKELDPEAASAFDKFRFQCTSRYQTIENAWYEVLDKDKSGVVGHSEFLMAAADLGYTDVDEIDRLFELLLVQPGRRSIGLADIRFLQAWDEAKRLAAFRKRLPTSWVNKDPYRFCSVDDARSSSKSSKSVDYENVVAVDDEQTKQDFRIFLVKRYGSLPKAFDTMDANGSGSLSLVEFQAIVSSVLRYCRSADAKRLFYAFNDDPVALLTWKELGITAPEWSRHTLEKQRTERRVKAEALANLTAPLGSTPRQRRAQDRHTRRIGDGKHKVTQDVAFGMPLPGGWGPPPSFEPQYSRPMTAR